MSPTAHSTTESEVPTAQLRRGETHGWTLYVIDLQKVVLTKGAFKKANPGYTKGKPCVYVGLTVKTAKERYDEHKAGIRDGRYVKRHGKRVRVSDCRCLRSMTRKRAEKKRPLLRRGCEVGVGEYGRSDQLRLYFLYDSGILYSIHHRIKYGQNSSK